MPAGKSGLWSSLSGGTDNHGNPTATRSEQTMNIPVTHSIPDENALAVWMSARYMLNAPVRCRFFRRSISDVYRVDAHDASYILKVYMHGRHSMTEIEAEIDFLNDLKDLDVAVAAPVADKDRGFLNQIAAPEGTRYAVLFPNLMGDAPQEENLEHSCRFGRLAGRLHRCADTITRNYDRGPLDDRYLIDEPLRLIEFHFPHRQRDLEYLKALSADLKSELHLLVSRNRPEYGLCHGDLHTGNARFDGDGRLTLFDFDSFGCGWRAMDIGVYHVSYDWMDLSDVVESRKACFWESFVDGYSEERSLSGNELAVAQLCLPVRHLELMGLSMRYWSPYLGISWMDDSYLDRHMNWFKEWARKHT